MELLFVIALVVLGISTVVGGLAFIPSGRWSFSLGGRRFEVINYGFRERILVDGQPVSDTRVGGDGMTQAIHAIALPDGRQLDVRIGTQNGLSVECTAEVDGEVIFDSRGAGALGLEARARLPGELRPEAPDPPETVEDPRWEAALVLLQELAENPALEATVEELSQELRRALHRLVQAHQAAEAHHALGGSSDELAPVLQAHEAAVQARLDLLRQLHLAASSPAPTEEALPDVRDALDRLKTEQELDEVEREAKRLARARQRALSP